MEKKKIILKLVDVFVLQQEIDSLLNQELLFVLRYKLLEIKKKIQETTELAIKIQNELVQKYGKEENKGTGVFTVKENLPDGSENPKYKKFKSEWDAVFLTEDKEFEIVPLDVNYFEGLKTKNMVTIFQLIKE